MVKPQDGRSRGGSCHVKHAGLPCTAHWKNIKNEMPIYYLLQCLPFTQWQVKQSVLIHRRSSEVFVRLQSLPGLLHYVRFWGSSSSTGCSHVHPGQILPAGTGLSCPLTSLILPVSKEDRSHWKHTAALCAPPQFPSDAHTGQFACRLSAKGQSTLQLSLGWHLETLS